MDKQKVNLLKKHIKNNDFQSFTLHATDLTDSDVRVLFDNYIIKYNQRPKSDFFNWFVCNCPSLVFKYLSRLYFSQNHQELILSKNYLKVHEYSFEKEIISFLKAGFSIAFDKAKYIDYFTPIGASKFTATSASKFRANGASKNLF